MKDTTFSILRRLPAMGIILLIVAGCSLSNRDIYPKLEAIEQNIQDHPDSCLMLLEGIRHSKHRSLSERDSAYFILLEAEARYKAAYDDTINTRLPYAIHYYEKEQDINKLGRAYLQLGLTHYYSKKYMESIIDFLKAEKRLKGKNDPMQMAMTYRGIADSYYILMDYASAAYYYRLSIPYFIKFNGELTNIYIADIYSLLAGSELCIAHYDTARKYANKAYDIAQRLDNDNYRVNCLRKLGEIGMHTKNYNQADTMYSQLYTLGLKINSLQLDDYRNIGFIYLNKGEFAKAKEFSNHIMSVDSTDTELERQIALQEGDIKRAYILFENALTYQNDFIVNNVWSKDFASVIRQYYEEEERDSEEKIVLRNHTIILMAISGVLFTILFVWVIIRLVHRLKSEKHNRDLLIAKADNLEGQLSIRESDINALRNEITIAYSKAKQIELDAKELLKNLFGQQFDEINNLCQAITESKIRKESNPKERLSDNYKLYDGIASSFDNFRGNGDYIKKIEVMANSMLDNIVDRFRNDFPKIREQDVTLMILSIANFNTNATSLFLDIEPNLVHSRKYKLKVRILNSDSIYKDEYLSYLPDNAR
ncbi:MAG: tetratricopeptide repeat protein [Lepagella sp.]